MIRMIRKRTGIHKEAENRYKTRGMKETWSERNYGMAHMLAAARLVDGATNKR